MKNYKSRFLAIALIAALASAPLAGCADDKDNKEESSSSGSSEPTTVMLQVPFEFHYDANSSDTSSDDSLNAQDPTAPQTESSGSSSEDVPEFIPVTEASGEPATEYVEVTDAQGETVTEFIPVTEAGGEPATEAAEGQPVTEAVPVTEVVEVTMPNPEYNGESSGDSNSDYTANTDEAYAYWIDISKEADWVFNDEFISVKFKVKDTAPDGAYDIVISNPDFANFDKGGSPAKPDIVQNGKVFVNTPGEAQREFTEDDGFVVYADNVECKQGDEITVNFSLKNNKGLVGMNFWFEFDSNALELISCTTAGEFAEIANRKTSFGETSDAE